MAAVPVSDVAFVMSRKSKASCYLLRGLLYGPGYASLLRLLEDICTQTYIQSIWADLTTFAQQSSLIGQSVMEYPMPVVRLHVGNKSPVVRMAQGRQHFSNAGTGQGQGMDADGALLALQSLLQPSANPQIRAWQQARSVNPHTM